MASIRTNKPLDLLVLPVPRGVEREDFWAVEEKEDPKKLCFPFRYLIRSQDGTILVQFTESGVEILVPKKVLGENYYKLKGKYVDDRLAFIEEDDEYLGFVIPLNHTCDGESYVYYTSQFERVEEILRDIMKETGHLI